MKISAIVVLVGEGCENFSARQITLRDLVTLANVISLNDIGASMWGSDFSQKSQTKSLVFSHHSVSRILGLQMGC